MPAGSEPGPCRCPHTWRPLGSGIAGAVLGGGLLRGLCAARGSASTPRPAPGSRSFQRGTLVVLGLLALHAWFALVRSRVVAEARPAGGGQRLPPPRVRWAAGRRACACRPARRGSPSTSPTAPPRPAMGIQGSDGGRAQRAVRELRRSSWRVQPADRSVEGADAPGDRELVAAARRPAPGVTRSSPRAERVGLGRHRLDRQRAAARCPARRRRCRAAATAGPRRPTARRRARSTGRAARWSRRPSASRIEVGEGVVEARCRASGRAIRKSYAVPVDRPRGRPAAAGRRPASGVAAGRVSSQPSTGPGADA